MLAGGLIGFGRSDKPSRIEDYTYLRHVEWVTSWFDSLDLREVTLVVQDWGSLTGLRIAAEQGDRIARIVANGFLPTARRRTPPAFYARRAFARYGPVLPAGARAFPQLVPTSSDDPAIPANRAAWDALSRWEKPFLAIFGARDPILG